MNSLVLVNYFEKQAKASSKLKELMAQAAQCLSLREEQRSLERALLQETLFATMDVYELEGIFEQLKLQYQQQRTLQDHMQEIYKNSIEFCVQVRSLDWDAQLHCKLELMQMQCQTEMRELSEEYEAERQRVNELEQRPMVQTVRATEEELASVQAKMENSKKLAATRQGVLGERLKEMRNERNALVVGLVAGRKQIAGTERELETIRDSKETYLKELIAKKQTLISNLRKLDTELPICPTENDLELNPERILPQMNNAPVTTKLEAFLNQINASNATVCEKRKGLSFTELFKEWKAERQMQFKHLVTTSAKPCIESTSINANTSLTSLDGNYLKATVNVASNAPRSILRRPSITDEEYSGMAVPQKRVRFATLEVEDRESRSMTLNAVDASADDRGATEKVEKTYNDIFVIEDKALFNGDTETIEILSTGETEAIEQAPRVQLTSQKGVKKQFVKANKLIKKARLLSSQKLNRPSKVKSAVAGKPKIEIQEIRIIKPAGTQLPTKLHFELTPPKEPPPGVPANRTRPADALQPTTNKLFKSPLKPVKRNSHKMTDCNTFFREFLKQSNEDDCKTAENTSADEPSKPKSKKSTINFESFFRENIMSSNESNDILNDAIQATSRDSNDDTPQFDLQFDENQGLLSDFFDDQAINNGKTDVDFLSFDFHDEKKKDTSL